MLDISLLVNADKESQEVQGSWYTIQWSPDPRNGERYNIGVAVIGEDGSKGFRLLDNYKRLECIYGKDSHVAYHAELACQVIEAQIENFKGDFVSSLENFPQFFLERRGYVKDFSYDQAAEDLYYEMVPLAREFSRLQNAKPVTRSQIVKNMRRSLKARVGRVSSIMPTKPYFTPHGMNKKLYLPVRSDRMVASIASARVATGHTAKLNIYEAQKDISIARGLEMAKNNYLHLLLPSDEADKKQVIEIENQVDSVDFILRREGVKLLTHNSEEEMLESVIEEFNEAV